MPDQVVVARFISSGDNSTLMRGMFSALRDRIDPTIAAISTVMIAISSLLILISQASRSLRRTSLGRVIGI